MIITSNDLSAHDALADSEDFERTIFNKLTNGLDLSPIDYIVARLHGWEPTALIEEIEARKSM
jgi:hypothetical protein